MSSLLEMKSLPDRFWIHPFEGADVVRFRVSLKHGGDWHDRASRCYSLVTVVVGQALRLPSFNCHPERSRRISCYCLVTKGCALLRRHPEMTRDCPVSPRRLASLGSSPAAQNDSLLKGKRCACPTIHNTLLKSSQTIAAANAS